MDSDDFNDLSEALDGLDSQLTDAGGLTRAFSDELGVLRKDMAATTRDLGSLSSGFSSGLRKAFDGLIFGGQSLSESLRGLAQSMSDTAYNAALRPVTDHLGGMLATGVNGLVSGLMPFKKGGSFAQGRVQPFATGGIVTAPTRFPMRGGRMGLMGEAGPEAIMPLGRGPDGKLGVRADSTTRPTQVVINVTTPDAESFSRSRSQIAAQMSRALSQGQRNR